LLIALVGLRVLPFVPDRAAGDVADRQG